MATNATKSALQLISTGNELPLVTTIGLTKVRGGWVVVRLMSRGMKIESADLLTTPEPWADAAERIKARLIDEIILGENEDE